MDFTPTDMNAKEPQDVGAVPLLLPPNYSQPKREPIVEEKPVIKIVEQAPPPIEAKRGRGRPKKVEPPPPVINIWEPEPKDFNLVYDLAALGWPTSKVAEKLEISDEEFASAMLANPDFRLKYDEGLAAFKKYEDKRISWRPEPDDIRLVEQWARQGLREPEIAAKLKVGRAAFMNRLADTPQLKAAMEQGDGDYRADLIESSNTLLETDDHKLRNAGPLLIFKLKAHCQLTDKAPVTVEPKKVQIEGEIKHTHQPKLAAPEAVATENLAEFAKLEMDRAQKLSTQKLKTIEAEIIE